MRYTFPLRRTAIVAEPLEPIALAFRAGIWLGHLARASGTSDGTGRHRTAPDGNPLRLCEPAA